MDEKELRQFIHDLHMGGEKRKDICAKIQEATGCVRSTSYRHFDRYLKDPIYMGMRDDIKESIKKSLYAMWITASGKNQHRAAVEVLDRLLVVCPWIKDEETVKKDMEINLIINEWKKDDGEKGV